MATSRITLMVCENRASGKKSYFESDSEGKFVRVSGVAYRFLYATADRLESIHSKTTHTHRRSYRTAVYKEKEKQ